MPDPSPSPPSPCPRCRLMPASDAPRGLCPDCLLAVGLAPVDQNTGHGTTIGPYRLLDPIGEGGMGTVFMAEQWMPIKRDVALKLMKTPAGGAEEMMARFAVEREALEALDHPGIAALYDAGATDEGRPWVAMELVEGLPITQFCRRENLPLEARLRVLEAVCDAVQHAHQHGVIHRDLKPSNILVARGPRGEAMPKVIDFGLASAGAGRVASNMPADGVAIAGTPGYLSPEQAWGSAGDTRSDVFALGAVLFEVVSGEPLFGREARLEAARDFQPGPRLDALRLGRMPRELCWIVARALAHDPGERYQSPHELAVDLERLRSHHPVLAAPASMLYRAGKFVRRHRGRVLAAGAVVVASVLGVTLAVAQSVRVRVARQEAFLASRNAAAEHARNRLFSSFITHMSQVPPNESSQGNERVRQMLRAVEGHWVKEGLLSEPDAEFAARQLLASAWSAVGGHAEAKAQLGLARGVADHSLESMPDDPRRIMLEMQTGHALIRGNAFAEAAPHLEKGLTGLRRLHGNAHPEVLGAMHELSMAYFETGRTTEAASLIDGALELEQEMFGPGHENTLHSKAKLAEIRDRQNRPEEAVKLREEAHQGFRVLFGDDDLRTRKAAARLKR